MFGKGHGGQHNARLLLNPGPSYPVLCYVLITSVIFKVHTSVQETSYLQTASPTPNFRIGGDGILDIRVAGHQKCPHTCV